MGQFLQSRCDFPLTVALGEKSPTWGLARWRGNKGLRFVPPDDEGYTLRGDRRRLLYKGRRRSHRFTVLGDNTFEYDCILLREPESNVIILRMDGAETFDFFRQPDFLKEPLLAGSYAVYKKETLIGEGTGKLCHIHRPEIIDARGRRCWGKLAVVGDELLITIPEAWLGEAKYPVVVDPVIGTTTVGSQITGSDPDFSYYDRPIFENQIAVCKYPVSQSGSGQCTAYVYAYYNYEFENVKPVLFTEQNNRPYWRISKNQQTIPTSLYPADQEGWKSGTFLLDGTMYANGNIWFGVFSGFFSTRFDYGGDCYKYWNEEDEWLSDDLPAYIKSLQKRSYMNIKFSWFFIYGPPESFIRKLTQGVSISDNRKSMVSFKRKCNDNVKIKLTIIQIQEILRSLKEIVSNFDLPCKFLTFRRDCIETVVNSMIIGRFSGILRSAKDRIGLTDCKRGKTHFSRRLEETVNIEKGMKRILGIFRKSEDFVCGIEKQEFHVLFYRSIDDTAIINCKGQHWEKYIREIKLKAESSVELVRIGDFFRTQAETVKTKSGVIRRLSIFIKIVTTALVRDYILSRFLKAKSELIMKSCVTREITLDSKISEG